MDVLKLWLDFDTKTLIHVNFDWNIERDVYFGFESATLKMLSNTYWFWSINKYTQQTNTNSQTSKQTQTHSRHSRRKITNLQTHKTHVDKLTRTSYKHNYTNSQTHKHTNTWRQANTTHSVLIPELCETLPLVGMLYKRLLKLVNKCLNTQFSLLKIVVRCELLSGYMDSVVGRDLLNFGSLVFTMAF